MTDKFRGPDPVIVHHPEAGELRLDPERFGPRARASAKKEGWTEVETQEDGFRKRRKRTAADMKRLIAEGIVADPEVGPQAHIEYPPETFVFKAPLGQMNAEGREPGGKDA